MRRKLTGTADGDRQMVEILTAVLTDSLAAVEAACAESRSSGIASADVILSQAATTRSAPTGPDAGAA